MSRYREIYGILEKSRKGGFLEDATPRATDDLLREAGIEAYGTDIRDAGLEAAIIYLAERVRDLEEKAK